MEYTSFEFDIPLHDLKNKILAWADQFTTCFYLDNNTYPDLSGHQYELLVGVDQTALATIDQQDVFTSMDEFLTDPAWYFGFLSYDLKNQIEDLRSENIDHIDLPLIHFIKPRYVIYIQHEKVTINRRFPEAAQLYDQIVSMPINEDNLSTQKIEWTARIPKHQYLEKVNTIRQRIIDGDFYELNFCQEFYTADVSISPASVFRTLNDSARAPFSAYVKVDDKYLLCTSPERFLQKIGNKLISQPIKGTASKGANCEEDDRIKKSLQQDEKEMAENVMIVDLVRNDLTKCAETGSIKVDELFGVYGFEHVNHLISTVSCTVRPDLSFSDIIRNTFPMGSMTGAPKIEVMHNIEELETTKRGLYSGSVGYISPSGDFDFNVVIRSLLYDQAKKYLSLQVGGAITYDSVPEKEYEECLVKVKGIKDAINKG